MSTLRDVSGLLARIEAPGAFATRRPTSADDLHLEVKGVGRIRWPISRTNARRLCAAGRPARYGLKEQTRFDPRVRDTFEIPNHQVRPVTAGCRVVLTYNLMVDGDVPRTIGSAAAGHLDALTRSIERFFETPLPRRWAHEPRREPPDRLVYLLDHQYTRRSLAWNRLKNGDAVRAQVLREVARRLDCEIVLALADVHENWSCEDEGFGYVGERSE